jgi:radical SAM superfamily enzyme YgiQ (UPF0313 family)
MVPVFQYRKNSLLQDEVQLYSARSGGLPVSVVYPNSYHLGMSNLGYHSLCRLIGTCPGLSLDRYFYEHTSETKTSCIQKNNDLGRTKVIFASVHYEEDAICLLEMLHRAGIEIDRRKRKAPFLVIGGALISVTAEPFKNIGDVLFQGYLTKEVKKIIRDILLKGNYDKSVLLEYFMRSGDFIIPGAMEKENIHYPENPEFEHSFYLTRQTEFSNVFLMEIGRGCLSRCIFCPVNQLYPQPYWRRQEEIKDIYQEVNSRFPGLIKSVGLIAPLPNYHPDIKRILEFFYMQDINVSLSSIRIGKTDKEFFELLKKCRQKSFTIAPEVPCEEARRRIGKNVTDQEILRCIDDAYSAGFREIKMYFLIGIQGMETVEDIENLKRFIAKLPKNVRFKLSFNPTVPKPKTVMNGHKMTDSRQLVKLAKAIQKMKRSFHHIEIKIGSLKKFDLQYKIANGDENILTDIFINNKM